MKLSRAADFSLRLLVHMAGVDTPVTSEAMAKELKIPYNHLAKLVQRLAGKGYVKTSKGRGGGMKLLMDPKKISMREVIECIEGPINFSDCLVNKDDCSFSPKCKVRGAIWGLQKEMAEKMDRVSIFELSNN
jgi:Rrf2 family nitric oxide-sensitive transcriptional repressor